MPGWHIGTMPSVTRGQPDRTAGPRCHAPDRNCRTQFLTSPAAPRRPAS